MGILEKWKQRSQKVKVETYALYLAYGDPRTPWYAKLLAVGVVAYAVSPIDLIPDFIPLLGILDDLVIVPLGTLLAIRMVPREVMAECREKAFDAMGTHRVEENKVPGCRCHRRHLVPGSGFRRSARTQNRGPVNVQGWVSPKRGSAEHPPASPKLTPANHANILSQ